MKEINLQDLLNLADASAHDDICDFWNHKTIHYLVVFTCAEADFEIIGVGPELPCANLDAAAAHVIPGKTAEFYVKCPAAVIKRLQPKLAPAGLYQPLPSMKGRTTAPFIREEAAPASPPRPSSPSAPSPASAAIPTPPPPTAAKASSEPRAFRLNPRPPAQTSATPPAQPPTPSPGSPATPAMTAEDRELLKNYAERLAALETRERSVTEREAQLAARLAELKQHAR